MGDDWSNYIYDPNTDWSPTTWVGAEGTLGDQPGDFSMPMPDDYFVTPSGVVDAAGNVVGPIDPYGPGSGWGNDTLSNMKATNDTEPSFLDKLIGGIRGVSGAMGGKSGTGGGLGGLAGALKDLASSKAGLAGLGMLLAWLDKKQPKGGGTTMAYPGPKGASQPTIAQGPYGPIARYAANGGIMHAYREGGKVQMEDGGFVLTKRAVEGAGGPEGVTSLVPGARMIYGPGTGTSDDIPAQINGKHGTVEARLSNGEAYVSPEDVQNNGGVRKMYATMRQLERRA